METKGKGWFIWVLLLAVLAPTLLLAWTHLVNVAESKTDESKIRVMIIGSHHFSNPGQDVHNTRADDMQSPARQAQLQQMVEQLLAYHPTMVAVERLSERPDLSLPQYEGFTAGQLTDPRFTSETAQLGYRLALAAGLSVVYGIDEQPQENEPDYFPYGELQAAAAQNAQRYLLDNAAATTQAFIREFERRQAQDSIAGLLLWLNQADMIDIQHQPYMQFLLIGDNEEQAGADLNAMWYLRNAKIFSKLMHQAKPGDNVVVIFGSGHSYWLRQLARQSPNVEWVELADYVTP
ncbi:DUF5694 domain-containing protein [Shewanella sp. GXUN23E]|uniref:DUF5694 domain-containing protein n=1 Tax=Shewanella sp. GXUN23E TaxID=3422498 RepID=UPI003D7DA897